MVVFVISLIVVLAMWPLINRIKSKKINRKLIYCVICGLVLLVVAGTRVPASNFGDDNMYIKNFNYVQDKDFVEVYDFYKMQDTEVVFYELIKVVSLFTNSYNVLMTVCAVPIIVAVTRMIYKKSKRPVISFIIFMCAFFFLWSLVLLRQAIAMAIIIIAIDFLSNKKWIKFVAAVLLAFLFHRTAIVFLLALPLSFIKYSRKSIAVFVGLCVITVLFGNILINASMDLFSNSGHFSAYLTREDSFGNWRQIYKFIIYLVMMVVAICSLKPISRRKDSLSIHLCMIGCLFCLFAPFFAETYRLGLYFLLPIIILLPNALDEIDNEKQQLVVSSAVVMPLIILGIATFNSMGYASLIW